MSLLGMGLPRRLSDKRTMAYRRITSGPDMIRSQSSTNASTLRWLSSDRDEFIAPKRSSASTGKGMNTREYTVRSGTADGSLFSTAMAELVSRATSVPLILVDLSELILDDLEHLLRILIGEDSYMSPPRWRSFCWRNATMLPFLLEPAPLVVTHLSNQRPYLVDGHLVSMHLAPRYHTLHKTGYQDSLPRSIVFQHLQL